MQGGGFSPRLALVPTTKVAVWGPLAKRPPARTRHFCKAFQFSRVRAGGRLANGPQTATLVVGTKRGASFPFPQLWLQSASTSAIEANETTMFWSG